MTCPLVCTDSAYWDYALSLARQFQLTLSKQTSTGPYWLELAAARLVLLTTQPHGPVYAEFVEGNARHRRYYGGGHGQLIARAAGLKGAKRLPYIVDATAGLGRDSFVLASLGCRVTMIERSAIAAALISDALHRARQHPSTVTIANRMILIYADAILWLKQLPLEQRPDVVLVDPMFTHPGKKSAAAKKEMQAFQRIIDVDQNNLALLTAALDAALYRVAVKRPRLAPHIDGLRPSARLEGRSTRFDLYFKQS